MIEQKEKESAALSLDEEMNTLKEQFLLTYPYMLKFQDTPGIQDDATKDAGQSHIAGDRYDSTDLFKTYNKLSAALKVSGEEESEAASHPESDLPRKERPFISTGSVADDLNELREQLEGPISQESSTERIGSATQSVPFTRPARTRAYLELRDIIEELPDIEGIKDQSNWTLPDATALMESPRTERYIEKLGIELSQLPQTTAEERKWTVSDAVRTQMSLDELRVAMRIRRSSLLQEPTIEIPDTINTGTLAEDIEEFDKALAD